LCRDAFAYGSTVLSRYLSHEDGGSDVATVVSSDRSLLKVKSVPTSIAFYEKLGFSVANSFTPDGIMEPRWASLTAGSVEIMVGHSSTEEAHSADALYLYAESIEEMHARAEQTGLAPTPIERPFFNPNGEFQLADPDGHSIYVA
jgi:hypothetical protein